MEQAITEITRLLGEGGALSYGGEAISQLEHASQCALLAEQAGSSPEMITASLLHDIGHLLHHFGENITEQGIDDTHEEFGAAYLHDYFSLAVTEPIRLHVPAKRYLCYLNKDYWAGLSPISKRTLELQGGNFSESQAQAFIAQPYAKDAVNLRLCDDQAKVRGLATPDLAHFTSLLKNFQ